MFPELVQLTVAECNALAAAADEIVAAGFDISDLGDGSFAINGLPAGTENLNASQLLRDVLAETSGPNGIKSEIDNHIALVLAKNAAIAYGAPLTVKEMNNMVAELFASSMPKYTPDGKTIISVITQSDIEKRFS